jgi:hypothetical protein
MHIFSSFTPLCGTNFLEKEIIIRIETLLHPTLTKNWKSKEISSRTWLKQTQLGRLYLFVVTVTSL